MCNGHCSRDIYLQLIAAAWTGTNMHTGNAALQRPRVGGGGDQMEHPIGFSDLKFEAFRQ